MLSSVSQTASKSGPTNPAALDGPRPLTPRDRLWQRLAARRLCTLTTRTPYGEPCSFTLRLQNRAVRPGDALWFFVERGSDLAFDVTLSPEVEIAVLEDDLCPWTLGGRAVVVGDLAHAEFTPGVPVEALRELPAPDSEPAQRQLLLRVDVATARADQRPAA